MKPFAYLRSYAVDISPGDSKPQFRAEYDLIALGIYSPGAARISVSFPLEGKPAKTADGAIALIQKVLPDVTLVRKDKAADS